MEAVVNQNTFYVYRNNDQISRDHHYEIKFLSTTDQNVAYMNAFQEWLGQKKGFYALDPEMRNNGILPDEFHCWCQAMEVFLNEYGFERRKMTQVEELEDANKYDGPANLCGDTHKVKSHYYIKNV